MGERGQDGDFLVRDSESNVSRNYFKEKYSLTFETMFNLYDTSD